MREGTEVVVGEVDCGLDDAGDEDGNGAEATTPPPLGPDAFENGLVDSEGDPSTSSRLNALSAEGSGSGSGVDFFGSGAGFAGAAVEM